MPLWPSHFFIQIKRTWLPFAANVNFKAPIIIYCGTNSFLLYTFNLELKYHERYALIRDPRFPKQNDGLNDKRSIV